MGSRLARVAALASVAVILAGVAACTVKDPPAAEIVTETFTFGPFDLEPVGTGGDRVQGWRPLARPSGDIAVKGIRWKVVDGAGTEIPSTDHRIHFHHLVAYSTRHRDPMCPSWNTGERFAAPGSERTPLTLGDGYAYFAGARDTWNGNYDIMNLSAQRQAGIRVVYDVTYTRNRSTLSDVQPYWLDLAACSSAGIYTVPGGGGPGSVHTRTATFTLPRAGYIVGVRSHLHDGGIDITTTTASSGVACRGVPVYEEEGGHDHGDPAGDDHHGSGRRLKEIPFCGGLKLPIVNGERVTVTGRYSNEVALPDAMGKVIVYVAELPFAVVPTTTRPTGPPTTRPASTTRAPATAVPTTTAPATTTTATTVPSTTTATTAPGTTAPVG